MWRSTRVAPLFTTFAEASLPNPAEMANRWITLTFLALLALVQADLWLGGNGLLHVQRLRGQLDELRQEIDAAKARNDRVQAEVNDLREGLEMVEDKARSDLGMIKRNEIYIQVTPGR